MLDRNERDVLVNLMEQFEYELEEKKALLKAVRARVAKLDRERCEREEEKDFFELGCDCKNCRALKENKRDALDDWDDQYEEEDDDLEDYVNDRWDDEGYDTWVAPDCDCESCKCKKAPPVKYEPRQGRSF